MMKAGVLLSLTARSNDQATSSAVIGIAGGECQAGLQLEGVGQAVVGDRPAFGDAADHLGGVVEVEPHQHVVGVAGDLAGRDLERLAPGRCEMMSSMAQAWTSVSAGVSASAGAAPKTVADSAAPASSQAGASVSLSHHHVRSSLFLLLDSLPFVLRPQASSCQAEAQYPQPVLAAYLCQISFTISGVSQARQRASAGPPRRRSPPESSHRRSPIRSPRRRCRAAPPGGRCGGPCPRSACSASSRAVGPQHADREVQPDQPLALAHRVELPVGQVARDRRDRMGVGVADHQRLVGKLGDVPETLFGDVGEVDQ